jgi:hypothetical protein
LSGLLVSVIAVEQIVERGGPEREPRQWKLLENTVAGQRVRWVCVGQVDPGHDDRVLGVSSQAADIGVGYHVAGLPQEFGQVVAEPVDGPVEVQPLAKRDVSVVERRAG